MIKDFSGIHNHSHFSFMDGISTPEEMIITAKEKGLTSIALTDHGHMHGTADFYFAGKKHGVKAIHGVEGYIIHDLQEWNVLKEQHAEDRKNLKGEAEIDLEKMAAKSKDYRRLLRRKGHLVLIAQNRDGLSNLYQITHKAHKLGFYQKPRADKKILADHSKGVIASSACMGGVISTKCWQWKNNEAEWNEVVREAEEFREIFGDRFFLELQFNEHEGQRFINDCLTKVHLETGIPLVVTADAHYIKSDDWETQEILHLLLTHRGGKGITMGAKPEGYDFKTRSLYIKSAEEMYASYLKFNPEIPREIVDQAFANTLLVDSMVDNFEPDTSQRLPSLPYSDTFKELGQRSIIALKARGLANDEVYKERLLYELKMIKEKGISNYFLIVQQIVEAASKEMLIGPGRGSAGGSLICYLLGITNIDPIEHKLMFERFINVDRVETPDVDLDFEDVDRVKDILGDMFGQDNVACISTFGTNQIKGILKDVCRVYDIDHTEINLANAKIEKELQAMYQQGEAKSAVIIKMEDVYRLSKTFRELIAKYPHVEKPVQRLYGRAHHVSRHASGVVIGDNLPAETAVFTSKGELQTSFTDGVVNKQLSAMGLVKFDILGLATLSIIHRALNLISQRTGRPLEDVKAEIDPKKINFNDQEVIKNVFWKGNLTGIFQCTSSGMRRMIQMIKPDCFDDVAACGALYRPGPLGSGMDRLYAENKKLSKEGKVKYDHPILEEILKDTYGCFVYQEHILELGRKLGKLSWKDTNRLRKLFLKRTKDAAGGRDAEADELKGKLAKGFIENGLTQEYADKTWKELEAWASYGFNAAHAKAYGMVTMQTAYLRHYYPLEFFTAVLSCGQASELQDYVDDIKKQGFKILPVCVNKSKVNYFIEENAIRLSLSSVDGVGSSAAEKIVANQPYTDLLDVYSRSGANKTAIESFIKAGAFSDLEENMGLLLKQAEFLFSNPKLKTKKHRDRLLEEYKLITSPDIDVVEKMQYEREFLGFNLRGSPFTINGRKEKIDKLNDEGAIYTYGEFIESPNEVGMIPVFLKDFKEKPQKNKQMFAFMKFIDQAGQEFEAPCFSTVWAHVSKYARKGDVYLVTFNHKEEDPSRLVVGKSGWGHSPSAALSYFIKLDGVQND